MNKKSWQEQAKRQAIEASSIEIDMALNGATEIIHLWSEWCEWRTELSQLEKLKPWTPRAARAEMRNLAIAATKHEWSALAQHMRNAITSCWTGMNLDKMRSAKFTPGVFEIPDRE